jgi:hypothetical protein
MNAETRDSVLRMILPALLVLIGYVFLFDRTKELRESETSLASAKSSAVDEFAIGAARLQSATLSEEQAKLKKEKDDLDARWSRLSSFPSTNPAKRAAALRQLTRMLWDRGLYPFEEAPAEQAGQLPASFDDVLKRLTSNGGTTSRLWQIRFYGRYADVVDTLSSLGDSDVALVPVGLTMSEAKPDTAWRVWTLLLWN